MSITLEQVDQVRDRTGVSYKAAKEALEQANGDVLEAIVQLEQEAAPSKEANVHQFGQDIIKSLKDLVNKGNVTRIFLDKDEKTIIDIPITAGAVGAIFFAPATVVAIIAALATGCELKIVKEDGEVINIKDITKDAIDNVKEKINDVTKKEKHTADEDVYVDEEVVEEEFEDEQQ